MAQSTAAYFTLILRYMRATQNRKSMGLKGLKDGLEGGEEAEEGARGRVGG